MQAQKTRQALKAVLAGEGPVPIDLCLQVEHVRGLAHGEIYRAITETEKTQLPALQRQFGPLPLHVDAEEVAVKTEDEEDTRPCTLIHDLGLDFSARLRAAVLSRAEARPVSIPRELSPAVPKPEETPVKVPKKPTRTRAKKVRPVSPPSPSGHEAPAPAKTEEQFSLAGVAMIRKNGKLYTRAVVPSIQLLPLFIPDDSGSLAASVSVSHPSLPEGMIVRSVGGTLTVNNGSLLEKTTEGWVVFVPVASQDLLKLMIPDES